MESLILAHSLTRIRWYLGIQASPNATPAPRNPAGEKREKAKKLKRREAGQNKSASDMAERVAYLRLLSGERVFARQRINTMALDSILIPAFDCYRLAFGQAWRRRDHCRR